MELHAAARAGDVEKARRLVVVERVDVNARDNLNRTPLHLAAWAGQAEMVLFLCENKAAVGAAASDDMAAIHFACQKGHLEVVRALFAAGAKVTGTTRKGLSPLHYAVQNGNAGVIRAVARKAPQMMTATNGKGQKPADVAKSEDVKSLLRELEKEFAEKRQQGKEKREGKKKESASGPSGARKGAVDDGVCRAEEEIDGTVLVGDHENGHSVKAGGEVGAGVANALAGGKEEGLGNVGEQPRARTKGHDTDSRKRDADGHEGEGEAAARAEENGEESHKRRKVDESDSSQPPAGHQDDAGLGKVVDDVG